MYRQNKYMENKEIVAEVKDHFYWLHRHPELSGEEFNTTEYLKNVLASHNVPVYPLPLSTGLVAHIGQGNPIVAIRCDIDALPMQEESGLEYSSKYPGRMHACGHDFHAAALLGVAISLQKETSLPGTVKLIFQPAEETLGGARQILETGILDDVQAIFGLHCCAAYSNGTIISRPGFMNSAVDELRIDFLGRGAHACRPHTAADPIIMIGSFIQAVQTIVSRNANPFHPLLVGISHIEAGTAKNIIPEKGFVEGTIRSLYPEDRKLAKERLKNLACSIAESFGGRAVVHITDGTPATNNSPEWVTLAEQVAHKLQLPFVTAPDSLSGEDFAFYQQKIPGSFIQIGTGVGPMMHTPAFRADPDALKFAVRFGAQLVQEALEKLKYVESC